MMNSFKKFKICSEYYLKYINSPMYLAESTSRNIDPSNSTYKHSDDYITGISICDVLSNDGIEKLLRKLDSLSAKQFEVNFDYIKPAVFKHDNYMHLQYSHSSYSSSATIKFIENRYIHSVSIKWSQINNFYALIEYDFHLKENMDSSDCTKFNCETINELNSNDYVVYYKKAFSNTFDFYLLEEMDCDFFILIFQHYVTSLFYSELGHNHSLIRLVKITNASEFDITSWDFEGNITYYNRNSNYIIQQDFKGNYYLLSGKNTTPAFTIIHYIEKYGNNFFYLFFDYWELQIFEYDFSKYVMGNRKIKYNKKFFLY